MATHNQEEIIRYVDNELSAEERQQIEADLANDAELAAGVRLYMELKATLQERLTSDAGRDALRTTLEGMNKRYFSVESGAKVPAIPHSGAKVVSFRKYLTGFAAAASVIVATVLLWPSEKGGYLDTYGNTQMVVGTERGDGNDTLMQKAAAYFNEKEFGKALPLFDRIVGADSSNQEALFYRGVAQLLTGGTGTARSDLGKVYNGGSIFRYEAAFYIALSYAQQKDTPQAMEWLGRIPAGAPAFDKAAALKKKLE